MPDLDEDAINRLEDQDDFDAIYITPCSAGVEPSIAFQQSYGPKRYLRFWLRNQNWDHGWVVHDSAICLWSRR